MYLVNIYRDALSLVYFTKLIIIIINSGYLFLFLRTGRTSIKVRFYSFYKWLLFYQRVGLYQFGFLLVLLTNDSTNGLYQPFSCQPTINHVPTQPSTWLTSLYTCLPNHQPLPSRDILSSVQGVHTVSSHRYANQPELLSSTSNTSSTIM